MKKFRDQSDQDAAEKLSRDTYIHCQDDHLTIQGPAHDADINNIVKSFGVSRIPLPPEVMDPAYYGDLTDIPDLRTILDISRAAQERFQALPASIRERFRNSPAALWDFVNDPRNLEEAVAIGLLHRATLPQTEASTPPPGQAPPA